MTTTVETTSGQTLTPLLAAVDSLLAADLGRLSRDELLDALRGLECESRRLAAVGHRVVAEVAARNVAGELRYRDTAALLSAILLLTRGQASDRVNAAEALGPRISLLGQPLPAVLPATARALTDGAISAAHTGVIRGLTPLPAPVRDEHRATVEALLASTPRGWTPRSCGRPPPRSSPSCTRTAPSPRTGCTAPTATSRCAVIRTAPGMCGRT